MLWFSRASLLREFRRTHGPWLKRLCADVCSAKPSSKNPWFESWPVSFNLLKGWKAERISNISMSCYELLWVAYGLARFLPVSCGVQVDVFDFALSPEDMAKLDALTTPEVVMEAQGAWDWWCWDEGARLTITHDLPMIWLWICKQELKCHSTISIFFIGQCFRQEPSHLENHARDYSIPCLRSSWHQLAFPKTFPWPLARNLQHP